MSQAEYQQQQLQQQNSGSPNRGFIPQQQAQPQQNPRGQRRRMRRPYNSRY